MNVVWLLLDYLWPNIDLNGIIVMKRKKQTQIYSIVINIMRGAFVLKFRSMGHTLAVVKIHATKEESSKTLCKSWHYVPAFPITAKENVGLGSGLFDWAIVTALSDSLHRIIGSTSRLDPWELFILIPFLSAPSHPFIPGSFSQSAAAPARSSPGHPAPRIQQQRTTPPTGHSQ